MKRIKKFIIWVAVTPLIALVAILGVPIALAVQVQGTISLRMFCRRERGHVYLICTSKRSWHDFLKNNVIPGLPESFRVVWHKAGRGAECTRLLSHLARSRVFGVSKPYIVVVTARSLLHRSLNVPLQELKAQSKRSAAVRKACAEIIQKLEEELRTSGPTVRAAARP